MVYRPTKAYESAKMMLTLEDAIESYNRQILSDPYIRLDVRSDYGQISQDVKKCDAMMRYCKEMIKIIDGRRCLGYAFDMDKSGSN